MKPEKLSDDEVLGVVRTYRDAARAYNSSELQQARIDGANAYRQRPYGNEEEGASQFVTSEVMDAVEWMKPALLKIFTASDEVVRFEPRNSEDVEPAKQATSGCNYVFMQQNNGFLLLHTAITDMLIKRNGAFHWRLDVKKQPVYENIEGTAEQVAMALQDKEGLQVLTQAVEDQIDETGQPIQILKGRIRHVKTVKQVKVEAFEPEDLLIDETHNSPLLDDCVYVARRIRTTLSAVREMGYKVEDEDVATDGDLSESSNQQRLRRELKTRGDADPALKELDLYYEYVLIDADGDGIAERRLIISLPNKILYNEVCDQVQIATASPVLIPHQWCGLSMDDLIGDIQRLKTEITRQMLDNLYLSNHPQTAVLTNADGDVRANIDDLLSPQVGGIVREYSQGAIRPLTVPFTAAQSFPMLEYADVMRERKSGITSYNQGLDSNSLNKTATGVTAILGQAMQRVELVARIIAEVLLKPTMRGILKLLVQSGLDEPLAYRLNNKFVEYNPNEWRDSYDTTVSVGLGTGNKDQQLMHLQTIGAAQMQAVQMGGMGKVVTLRQMYEVQKRITENAGFKDTASFWTDPDEAEQQQGEQEPQPDPEIIKLEQELALKRESVQADSQTKIEVARINAEAELQKEQMRLHGAQSLKGMEIEAKRSGLDPNAAVTINNPEAQEIAAINDQMRGEFSEVLTALMQSQAAAMQQSAQTADAIQAMLRVMAAPKQSTFIKDNMGRNVGAVSTPLLDQA